MIRCCSCMSLYENEDDLLEIVEQSEFQDDDNWHTVDRFLYNEEQELKDTETERYEIFKGCPYCLSDEYLMDIGDYIE